MAALIPTFSHPKNGVWRWRPIDTIGETSLINTYTDTSHSVRTLVIPGTSPVRFWLDRVLTNGDTSGNDIGNCTADDAYLTVQLRPLLLGFLCSGDACGTPRSQCAVCQDRSCQCGFADPELLCTGHGGRDDTLGCSQTP